jgi:GTP pyrophosphokinase
MACKLFEIIFNQSRNKDLAYFYMQQAHDDEGQIRKSSGNRYWTHPEIVCEMLEKYNIDDDICTASLLHDTVEDSPVIYDDIKDTFGKKVADLVKEVTNIPGYDGLSKENYMNKKLLSLSPEALYIKLADMVANGEDNPNPNQLKRMQNNIDFLVDNRKDLDPIHKNLIKRFKLI